MTTFPQLLSRIFNVLFFEPNNIFNNIVHLKSAQTCCFDDRVITCAASHRMARTAHVQHDIPQSMNHAEWTRTVQSCARNFSSTLPAHCRLSLRCLPMGGGGVMHVGAETVSCTLSYCASQRIFARASTVTPDLAGSAPLSKRPNIALL